MKSILLKKFFDPIFKTYVSNINTIRLYEWKIFPRILKDYIFESILQKYINIYEQIYLNS